VHKHLDLIKEAEALVKAEAEAKAKAEAEAKAKAEAEAKAKAEAAMKKKSTIICTKGKLVKKVTAVIPKCPKGYKKK
jgi:membrane protein involved in colicin uptake